VPLDRTQTSPRARAPREAAPRWGLRVVHPEAAATWVDLDARPEWQTLGRANGLDHGTVSREHVSFRRRGLVLEVRDEDSHNGTWLDGARLDAPAFLGNHPVLRIGDLLAVVEAFEEDGDEVDRDAVVGDAPTIRAARRTLARMAPTRPHVLLLGETGTGKERAAAELHRLTGRDPWVTFNCAGLGAQLADSQLFGHERGAFTGAERAHEGLFRRADGGTLFLDEVAELDATVQAKLLRVLETGEVQPLGSDRIGRVDVRVVAATAPELTERLDDGRFRRDLYARLSVASLTLPPLRERRGDVPAWLARFDARWAREDGGAPLRWHPEAVEAAMLAPWEENLRGVDRVVYQLRLHQGPGATVSAAHVARLVGAPPPAPVATPRPPKPTREELERALEAHGGSVRATAKHFQRDRRQIYRWMEAYGLK